MSYASQWARFSAADLRSRISSIVAAERVDLLSSTLISGPWQHFPGPYRSAGANGGGVTPGSPLGFLDETGIPWDTIEEWVRGALGIWNGRVDATFPMGRWMFGLLYMNRVVRLLRGDGPIPTIANGWAMRRLANTSYFRWISNPAVQAVGRRLSLGLSVASTVGDAVVVYNHGNPIDAFQQDGAGYVADVARLGFSGSTTAFLIAPNPVTGGLVIVTGVVWAGAEVVDHWDEITEFWGSASADFQRSSQWIYDQSARVIGHGWDWTADRWSESTEWVDERLDDLHDWAKDEANAIQDWSRGRLDDLSRGRDETTAWAGQRLDTARDWTGDRLDDLADVGDGLVEGGIDIGKKLIPGW